MKRLMHVLLLASCCACAAQNPGPAINAAFNGATASTPTFSPAAGSYVGAQSVTLSTATSGCASYLVWNTTGATSGGNLTGTSSTNPLTVSASETVYAQVQGCTGYNNSGVGNASYTITSGYIASSYTASTTANSATGSVTITCGAGGSDFVFISAFNAYHNYTAASISATNSNTVVSDSHSYLGSTPPDGVWEIAHIKNCTSGSTTITFTATGVTGLGSSYVQVARFAGLINQNLDAAGTWVQTTSGTTTTCSTTSTTGDLLIDLMGGSASFSGSGLTSGFTHLSGSGNLYSMDYNLSAAGSSSTVQMTTSNGPTNCVLAAYN